MRPLWPVLYCCWCYSVSLWRGGGVWQGRVQAGSMLPQIRSCNQRLSAALDSTSNREMQLLCL
jgi:hypothetical protein